jgi:O-antigen ligase
MLWLGLPIGIALWLILHLPKRNAFALIILLVLGLGVATQIPSVNQRLKYSSGYVTRENLWRANFEFFKERPLTGAGWLRNQELSGYYLLAQDPGATKVFSGHAHNDLIDALGSTGALGALAFLLWSGGVIWLAWKARNRGLVCAWVVFQLNGLTQLNFWEGKVTHQMMFAVALTLWALTDKKEIAWEGPRG